MTETNPNGIHPPPGIDYEEHLRGAAAEVGRAVGLAYAIVDPEGMAEPSFADVWKIAETIIARADFTHQGDGDTPDLSLDALLNH